MIDAAVLDVLARATEIGLPEHAATLTIIYDPFLRPAIRRRLEAAIAEASKRTTPQAAPEHVLRLAFLLAHPSKPPIPDPNDERGTERLFDELSSPYLPPKPKLPEGGAYRGPAIKLEPSELVAALPRRRWPVTRAVSASVTALILGIAGVIAIPYLIPTPMERFERSPLGTALADSLTDVIASSPGFDSYTNGKKAFSAPGVQKQLGPAAPAMARVLDAHEKTIAASQDTLEATFPPLEAAIQDADRSFAAAHIPAHLHAWGRSRAVWVLSYYVDERATDIVGGKAFSVVWARRLDRLNFDDSALWKSEQEEDLIVAMPKMEEILVQQFLPALTLEGQQKPLLSDVDLAPALKEVAKTAGDLVRAEVAHELHIAPKDASKLADLIAVRNASLDQLAGHGWRVKATSQLWLTPVEAHSVATAEKQGDLAASGFASDVSGANSQMKLVARPVLPLLREIARYQEEAFVGRLVEEALTAPPGDTSLRGYSAAMVATVAGELAALSRPDPLPKTRLWMTLRPLLSSDRDGSPALANAYVIRKLLAAAGLDHGLDGSNELTVAYLAAVNQLVKQPPDKVQAAAVHAYAEVFGHPVPTFTRQTVR
jgi:hypothetical protein